MMKQLPLLVIGCMLVLGVFAQQPIKATMELQKVENDRVKVVVEAPELDQKQITYQMPAVIPGSYSRKDYGRFITDFKAYKDNGRRLKKVKKKGANQYFIKKKAHKLARIEYYVNDTWDVDSDKQYIFQPGGTNIEAGSNFVLNHNGFLGYFEGYRLNPYEITVNKPADMYGATPLKVERVSATKDILHADSYVRLVDNPVMYSKPDTTSFMVGGMQVYVSVFSRNGKVTAKEMAEVLKPIGVALEHFFVELPTDQYHFLMFFPGYQDTDITRYGGFGALEHHHGSFYYIPEISDKAYLNDIIRDVSAHEFLHILTPLNVHSRYIAEFNFANPKMSAHLWMYEGVTEYFSNLVQVRDELMTPEDFMMEMRIKIINAKKHPDVSFTEMSANILDPEYQDMYVNVYDKGALIALLLDIRLLELSNGTRDLRTVMLQLADIYGPDQPFEDDELIDKIVEITYPEIGDFFATYVQGDTPLPYKEYFEKIGYFYTPELSDTVKSFGEIYLGYDEAEEEFVVQKAEEDNLLSLEEGDVVVWINSTPVTSDNFKELAELVEFPENDDRVNVKIKRDDEVLKFFNTPIDLPVTQLEYIETLENPAPGQLKLRKALMEGPEAVK